MKDNRKGWIGLTLLIWPLLKMILKPLVDLPDLDLPDGFIDAVSATSGLAGATLLARAPSMKKAKPVSKSKGR